MKSALIGFGLAAAAALLVSCGSGHSPAKSRDSAQATSAHIVVGSTPSAQLGTVAAFYSQANVCGLISAQTASWLVPGATPHPSMAHGVATCSVSAPSAGAPSLSAQLIAASQAGTFEQYVDAEGEGSASKLAWIRSSAAELGSQALATYWVQPDGYDVSQVVWRNAGFQLEFTFHGHDGDRRPLLIQLALALPV